MLQKSCTRHTARGPHHHSPLLEPLESRRLMADVVGASSTALLADDSPTASATASASATIVAPQRVYLTGNSMTDGVWYDGLTALLGRDGAPVQLGRQTGPGYTQAYNLNLKAGYITSGVDPNEPGVRDPWGNYVDAFAAGSWNAMTLQPSDRRLLVDPYLVDGTTTQNQADVPMSIEFMKSFAVNNPTAQVFAYSRPVRRTDLDDKGQPNGITFNYSAEWAKSYVDSGSGRNWNFISRSYTQQYMNLIHQAQLNEPLTAGMKPIRLIPVAEAWYNVDQMIKAGRFAGTNVKSMLDFYVDKSHPANSGAYLIALMFHSSLTGQDPRGVAPTSHYLDSTLSDPKVQSLLQQAAYEAMTYSGYSGWTTPLPGTAPQPPAPPPPPPPPAQSPYSGQAPAIFANTSTTIQAENFDNGGEGVAYHDADAGNNGNVYRSTAVDISATTDTGGGYTLGWTKAGEWLEYTIDVKNAGTYLLQSRVASTGSNGKFHVEVDGVDKTGQLLVPKTGGWQTFATVGKNVDLSAGVHVLRLSMDAIGSTGYVGNFNWIKLSAPLSTSPTPLPPPPPSPPPPTTSGGSISGRVFLDANRNAKRDSGEAGLSGWMVFIDTNNNGWRDGSELADTSDSNGAWSFTGLAAGRYKLRIQQKDKALVRTTASYFTLDVVSGSNITHPAFGYAAT